MKWPIQIAFPRIFGWSNLTFTERLKLMAFLAQAGGGVAMTAFAGYAMFALADLRAVWPLFYLGFGALVLVGIVITGFAGLLIVRELEISGPGGFKFKSRDTGSAGAALKEMTNAAAAAAPMGKPGEDGLSSGDSVILNKE